MKNRLSPSALIIAAVTLLATLIGPPASAQDLSWSNVRFEQKLGNHIPIETQLIDDEGRIAPLSQRLLKKPHVLVFTYYRCPNLCTLVLNGLVHALQEIPQRLGKDYDVVTVSINPAESVRLAQMKKRTYLARYGDVNAQGWHFLVASGPSIQALTEASGFHFEQDALSGEFNHPSGIIVLTAEGKISQYFFGIQFDPKLLSQSVDQAYKDKQGSITEEILLYCFHYDPKTHKNGKTIMAMIRLLGIMGAISLAALLIRLSLPTRNTAL